MARTSATFSVSLPPEMALELERVRSNEHRTRSELVREALRKYIRQADLDTIKARARGLSEEAPTPDEVEAIAVGQREFRAGKHRSLSPKRDGIQRRHRRPRGSKP
jgi:metal-responsive CopG/Arc/MetJ family transcriptional regulator